MSEYLHVLPRLTFIGMMGGFLAMFIVPAILAKYRPGWIENAGESNVKGGQR